MYGDDPEKYSLKLADVLFGDELGNQLLSLPGAPKRKTERNRVEVDERIDLIESIKIKVDIIVIIF